MPPMPGNCAIALARIKSPDQSGERQTTGIQPLWVTERIAIQDALVATGGNIQKAARLLEISPSTIYRKLDDWKEDKDSA